MMCIFRVGAAMTLLLALVTFLPVASSGRIAHSQLIRFKATLPPSVPSDEGGSSKEEAFQPKEEAVKPKEESPEHESPEHVVVQGERAVVETAQETAVQAWTFAGFVSSWKWHLISGAFLLMLALPILWVNETRHAQVFELIERGEAQCITISGEEAQKENRNRLIHIDGAMARSGTEVADDVFEVSFAENCIRLRRRLEIFQVIETTEDAETQATYVEKWHHRWHDSSRYKTLEKRINVKRFNLMPGVEVLDCPHVMYGGGFELPPHMVQEHTDFRNAADRIGSSVQMRNRDVTLQHVNEGWFYHCQVSASQPTVGDFRVYFEYVPDGVASVMALQVKPLEGDRDTFVPFRVISRGLRGSILGLPEEEEKEKLYESGIKSPEQMAREVQRSSMLECMLCCCCCACMRMACMGLMQPEIFFYATGKRKMASIILDISRSKCFVWFGRLIGWVLMLLTLRCLLPTLMTQIEAMPLYGYMISLTGSWGLWVCCVVGTWLIWAVIVVLTYSAYHPVGGACFMVALAMIASLPFVADLLGF